MALDKTSQIQDINCKCKINYSETFFLIKSSSYQCICHNLWLVVTKFNRIWATFFTSWANGIGGFGHTVNNEPNQLSLRKRSNFSQQRSEPAKERRHSKRKSFHFRLLNTFWKRSTFFRGQIFTKLFSFMSCRWKGTKFMSLSLNMLSRFRKLRRDSFVVKFCRFTS